MNKNPWFKIDQKIYFHKKNKKINKNTQFSNLQKSLKIS